MAESIAVIISSERPQAVQTALNLLEAAVAMEMEAHVYFTGDAVAWVGRPGPLGPTVAGADEVREEVARRLRELKEDGTVHVYACSRAMKTCDISVERLAAEVDSPAGFAYFLGVADEAKLTLSF
jgi:peroxiredoxin family protein